MLVHGWAQWPFPTSANEGCQGWCIGRNIKVGERWLALPKRSGSMQWKKGELGSRAPPDARSTGMVLRISTIGKTTSSQSCRRNTKSTFVISLNLARDVRRRSSNDSSETRAFMMGRAMWTGSRSGRAISALQLYWLELTIMIGPLEAAIWRSEKSGCWRKRESPGNL